MTDLNRSQAFWDDHARHDPLWAILSDPSRKGRRWDLRSFLETGSREVSLLMHQLQALEVDVRRDAALDFGCGVGRLTLALARYFTAVSGVDISPEMIRLAGQLGHQQANVHYVCNAQPDLGLFADSAFTFLYSNVVLQHVDPPLALGYIREFFRVLAPSGVLVFQLPSHLRPAAEQQAVITPMPDSAYSAVLNIVGDLPRTVDCDAELHLVLSVTNRSPYTWRQSDVGLIRVGNHWRTASGQRMLVQDDGRTALPSEFGPGDTCHLPLVATTPRRRGEYQLECDLVHEGISWFVDKGSASCTATVRVGSDAPAESAPDNGDVAPVPAGRMLDLPDASHMSDPGPLPMHGIDRRVVEELIREHGATLVHVEADERCGKEWVGYRYIVMLPPVKAGVSKPIA